jgi:nitroreductase
MDVLTAIQTRRSIRRYLDQPVDPALVEQLLVAAMQSPSARNQQPWHFVVIDDRALLDQIPGFMPNAAMVAGAPMAILLCADLKLEKSEGYWVVDCAAATENMLLAAHGLGLGACWCGVYPRENRMEALHELLGLPENVEAHSLVVIGHPAEQVRAEHRYRTDRVHRNGWAAS